MVLDMLVKAAQGLDLTLHRAFDLVPDVADAVEVAVKLGFTRILTSGGARTAIEGLSGLRQAMAAAKGRILIMPGSGVSAANAADFLALGVVELHASCSSPADVAGGKVLDFGFQAQDARRTDSAKVRALKAAISA
jgi:copper homeostasis protein